MADWTTELKASGSAKEARISESELFSQAKEFVGLLQDAAQLGDLSNTNRPEWKPIVEFLEASQSFTRRAGFYFGSDRLVCLLVQEAAVCAVATEFGRDAEALADETWTATELLDQLGMHTVKAFQKFAKN